MTFRYDIHHTKVPFVQHMGSLFLFIYYDILDIKLLGSGELGNDTVSIMEGWQRGWSNKGSWALSFGGNHRCKYRGGGGGAGLN